MTGTAGAVVAATSAPAVGRTSHRHQPDPPDLSGLLRQFPTRQVPSRWAATQMSRGHVLARVLAPPFTLAHPEYQAQVRQGLLAVLEWLRCQPGDTWQDRWIASGAERVEDWRRLPAQQLHGAGGQTRSAPDRYGAGLSVLICGDVIRPSIAWLLTAPAPKNLAAAMARTRDPDAFAELTALCTASTTGVDTRRIALARIAMIMAAKGGTVDAITVGDCVETLQRAVGICQSQGKDRSFRSSFFYQLLHSLGGFPATAPPTTRIFRVQGQVSVEELIDRYGIEYRPVRDLLVDYLRELQLASDYSTLRQLSFVLGKLFWRDLEVHHPGIDSLHLPAAICAAWKQRVLTKTVRTQTPDGEVIETHAPRLSATTHLGTVRTFYLDIAQWAADEPSRWRPWVSVCPIREGELARKKAATRRKSRMDQRTRERLPALPTLVTAVAAERASAAERLQAARAARPGEVFTVGGQTLRRPTLSSGSARIWGEEPETGKRHDLAAEEHRAFWTWATVEVLRHTGIRIEELAELSHHSLIQYRLPTTRELIPLLQIAPSKTDEERLLVINPELADALSAIISRIRDAAGRVPLAVAYDHHERVWNPPMPLIFQRRSGIENQPLAPPSIRRLLNLGLAESGLTDGTGKPLMFTPHDFRRVFLTDAVMHGMPPHIAQLVAGHRDINTTIGYTAVYPEEVINGHRAFIARRRDLRPSEEYRTPTEEEWAEFLGHFERRKVALGTCGRSYATPCIHEHSCLRCPLLRPDPAQRHRVTDIRDNLVARIDEAQREGWLGEAEGLKISLAGTRQKLAHLDEMDRRARTVHIGIPTFPEIAGRTVITKDPT